MKPEDGTGIFRIMDTNNDRITIRDYRPDDFEGLMALWEETGLTYPERADDAKTIEETLKLGGKLLVMLDGPDGSIIGSSWMSYDGRRIYLHHFGIRTDLQGKGFGKMLAVETMKFLRTMKKQVKLEVHKDNKAAIALYENLGFSPFRDYLIYMLRNVGLLLLFLWTAASTARAQGELFRDWDTLSLVRANTAAGIPYLSDDERSVILLTNLARLNGPLFAKTFLDRYMELSGTKASDYTRTLYLELEGIRDLPVLVPERDLFQVAREHAINAGKRGYAGHKGFNKRYKKALEKYSSVGENCDYGNHSPLQIVMLLLIDEGIEDLGHRRNMLDEHFNSIGVSIKPHKVYDYNCVMSFGSLRRSFMDYVK